MSFFLTMLAFVILCLIQNAVFTAVSRSRNSGDVRHHAKWALASNGIFFVMQIFLMGTIWKSIEAGTYWQIAVAGVLYTLSTATGSVWMMARMLKTETGKQKVGASAEPPRNAIDFHWKEAAHADRYLDAIKEYRIAHGVTLKAAKEIIDIYLQKLDGR